MVVNAHPFLGRYFCQVRYSGERIEQTPQHLQLPEYLHSLRT
jgi:hypothetical protein